MKYLFLHYGPGGNSQVEAKYLGHLKDKIDFWDQPPIQDETDCYLKLLHEVKQKFLSNEYRGIVGHSFGCDLALDLVKAENVNIDHLILINPLFNVAKAFIFFAEKLGKNTEKYRYLIEKDIFNDADFLIFLDLVMLIVTTPDYLKYYWPSEKSFEFYNKIACECDKLDFNMWRNVFKDFLSRKRLIDLKNVKKTTVLIGTKDPYCENSNAVKNFWINLGAQCFLNPSAGHYLHLEDKTILGDCI